MRDPNRIKPIMVQIEQEWNKVPDMRFFQFISCLAGRVYEHSKIYDLFYLEDDELKKALNDFGKEE